MERMFRPDYEDGTLEQMLLAPQPASVLVLAKVVAHWLRQQPGRPARCGGHLATPASPLRTFLIGLLLETIPLTRRGGLLPERPSKPIGRAD
jgi:heme exporter protein B